MMMSGGHFLLLHRASGARRTSVVFQRVFEVLHNKITRSGFSTQMIPYEVLPGMLAVPLGSTPYSTSTVNLSVNLTILVHPASKFTVYELSISIPRMTKERGVFTCYPGRTFLLFPERQHSCKREDLRSMSILIVDPLSVLVFHQSSKMLHHT